MTQPEQLVERIEAKLKAGKSTLLSPEEGLLAEASDVLVSLATALSECRERLERWAENRATELRELADCREALGPFASPRATTRHGDDPEGAPEDDVMKVEITAGDWMRACVVTGRMDVDYLRTLPAHARPSEAFIASLAAQPPSEASERRGT